MNKGTRIGRRVAGAVVGAGLVAGAIISTSTPAQAYSPNPTVKPIKVNTTGGNHYLGDPFDGTYFKKDPGGTALKMELRQGGWYVGKVEFHPDGEILYFYDTKNDGKTYNGVLRWYNDASDRWVKIYFAPPGTSKVVDQDDYNLDIPDGKRVYIDLYDNSSRSDYITTAWGVA